MKNDNTVLFFDGANFHQTCKVLNIHVDYRKLLTEFQDKTNLIRANYYTTVHENDEYDSLRPLIDWLDYNGFSVYTKPVREYTDSNGNKRFKGSILVDLTVGMLDASRYANHIVLFSGDGEYRPAIASLQDRGIKTTVISTLQAANPMISDDLRRQADHFIDLSSLAEKINRDTR